MPALHQQNSDSYFAWGVPCNWQQKHRSFQTLSALFIIISCKLALTGPRQKNIKIFLMLGVLSSVLQVPQYWYWSDHGGFLSDLTWVRWVAPWVEISTSLYIPLHRFHLCRRHTRSLERRMFSVTWHSYKALKEMWNHSIKVGTHFSWSLQRFSWIDKSKNHSPSFEKLEAN